MRFCSLCSGSTGNATFVEAAGVRLLVDAGVSCKRIVSLLAEIGVSPRELDAILITHEHSDHIRGVQVLSKKYDLPVFANAACWRAMQAHLLEVTPKNRRVFESDTAFFLGGLRILPFTIPHDAAHAVAYVLEGDGHRVAVCTDVGHIDERILDRLSGVEAMLFEANHDVDMLMAGSYPYELKRRILSADGHLSNDACGAALLRLHELGLRYVVLGHLSRENNAPELALVAVRACLEANGVTELCVSVADPEVPCPVWEAK